MTGACVPYVLVHCLALEVVIYALRPEEGRKTRQRGAGQGSVGGEGDVLNGGYGGADRWREWMDIESIMHLGSTVVRGYELCSRQGEERMRWNQVVMSAYQTCTRCCSDRRKG